MEHELWSERRQQKNVEQALGQQINDAIERATFQGRWIDDLTAKRIARFLEPGDGPLHDFAETGAILPDMEVALEAAHHGAPEAQIWTAELGLYCQHRRQKDAMPYLNEAGME
jgi:hypothetical protein